MSFKFAQEGLDFGETAVENIFIREYMPHASADQIKVYILGLLYARTRPEFSLNFLAEELSVFPEYARQCFEHWENLGLLQIEYDDDLEDFVVEYNSIRVMTYMEGSAGDQKISPSHEDRLGQMVSEIRGSGINSSQFGRLSQFISQNDNGFEILKAVLTFYYKDKQGTKFSAVSKILREIQRQKIVEPMDALALADARYNRSEYHSSVKRIISDRAQTNKAERDTMNLWIDELGFSEKEILDIVQANATKSVSPTINFMHAIIQQKYDSDPETREKEKRYRKIKKRITGTRYAVTAAERAVIDAWTGELHLTEEQIFEEIDKHSVRMKGASVGKVDDRIRNPNSGRGEYQSSGVRGARKAQKNERYKDTELEAKLLARSKKML